MPIAGSDAFARLLEASPSAVVVADARGRVVLLNEAAQRILGYAAREVRGSLHVADLYDRREDARAVALRLRQRAADVLAVEDPIDVDLRASNGDIVAARLTVSFLRNRAGVSVATLGVFEDRREVDRLTRRLAEVSAEVEAVERRTAGIALAAAASYELAQPLTAASGLVEMLIAEGSLAPNVSERLIRVMDQLDRMRRIARAFTQTVVVPPPQRPEREP